MKNKFTLFAVLVSTLLFGQDLKLEHLNSYWWSKTNYFTPCAGYDAGRDLVRLEYRITNLSDSVAVFPDYTIGFNTCRGAKEVNELITISVEDEGGNVVHQHNDGIAVDDDGLYYFFVSSSGCWEAQAGATLFNNTGQIGLSAGHFHTTNAFPSGMQLGFSPNFVPSTGNYKVKSWLNTPYFDRGVDCANDTTVVWLFIDKENKKVTEVQQPQLKTTAIVEEPCTDFTPITKASINTDARTITVDGSECTTKQVARYINFGANQILLDDGYGKQAVWTFTGLTWKDETALDAKTLQQYADLYPGVARKGRASYHYRIIDETYQNILWIKGVRY